MKDAFEKWAKEQGFDLTEEADGSYKWFDTRNAWEGWQGACAWRDSQA